MNLVSILGSIENLIIKNNTATSDYDVSDGLQNRVKKTHKGVSGMHETFPVVKSQQPVVFIEIDSTSDNISQIGNSARRNVELNFNIVSIMDYGMGVSLEGESREKLSLESIRLSQNIETLFRNNITISNTVDWCRVEAVTYSTNIEDTAYQNISIIPVYAELLTT